MTGADSGDGLAHRLWGGRYADGPAPPLDRLNRSLPVDERLWREDVEGSRAWVEALLGADVLTQEEAAQLDAGLERVANRLEGGIPVDSPDEDIHTLVERLLYEAVGNVAGKLHTGRSRNDQVATDARLWCLRHGAVLGEDLLELQVALADRAESTVDLLMPAYTHLRRAQPVRVAHWLLAHFWALQRDRERWRQALDRVAVLPLGSGAVAGCPFPIDRGRLRERLGFASVSPNSMDAVGDRDWVCELVFVAALVAAHLSRLAEDLVLFSTAEFGFVELPEAYTTGSSLMPQKRNPDGLELARGRAARLAGQAAAALNLLKGLASGYQKDLQEDKTLLFDAFDTLAVLLPVTRETVAGLRFDAAALAAAVGDHELLATDLADELVRRGVPFREAHGVVGELVRRAAQTGRPLLGPDSVAAEHPLLDRDAATLDALASVERRSVEGGVARAAVLAQLEAARRACA
ncbi:MAG: argininosuccinate lyase [Gemmatimonadota bacterium]|jgi:argininosuccinate lyase